MQLKLNFKNKYKLKKMGYSLLSILTLLVILFNAWINGKLVEIIITIILFYIYRPMFEKQYHSSTLEKCSIVSIGVFIVVTRVSVDISVSLFLTVTTAFTMTAISYFVRDLLDYKILAEKYKKKLEMFESKCLENLTEEELMKYMPNIRKEVIHIVYEYLHRDPKIKSDIFAYHNHISERTLFRYLKLVKNEYEMKNTN